MSFDGNRTSVASASRPAASSQRSPTRWGTAAQAGKEATSAGRVEPQDEPAAASIAGPSPQVEDRNESSRLGQDDWPNRNNTGAVNHDSTPELGQMLPGAESSIDTTAPQAGMVHQIAPMIASTGPSTDGNVYGLPAFGHSPEDGIFEPGSIYQTLYRTLRRKVFHAAARAEEMPTTVQESTHTEPPVTHVSSRSPEQTRHAKEHQISDSDNDCELDMRQEYTLLKVWTEEVASWVSIASHSVLSCSTCIDHFAAARQGRSIPAFSLYNSDSSQNQTSSKVRDALSECSIFGDYRRRATQGA